MKNAIEDLTDRLAMLENRFAVAFPFAEKFLFPPYVEMAEAVAAGLLSGFDSSLKVAKAIVDPADMDTQKFWGTPLGRLMFAAGAITDEMIPRALACEVLGFSRQSLHERIVKGSVSDTGMQALVLTEEIRALLRTRLDVLVK